MSKANDPAFPFGQISELTGQPINGFFAAGLTKREYFAAQALQGLLSDPNVAGTWAQFATSAVQSADALLDELEKGETKGKQ